MNIYIAKKSNKFAFEFKNVDRKDLISFICTAAMITNNKAAMYLNMTHLCERRC